MSSRPDVSEKRRNQILEAAMAVFAKQGFEQARMDDITQEAGLSKEALSLYFKSKDAIISAILRFFFSRAMKKLQGFLEGTEPPSVREQLLQLNQYYVGEMKWMVSMLPISFQFYAVAARQKAVRQFLKRYFKGYREVLTALIQRGIHLGEFKPMQTEDVAIAITALYEGLRCSGWRIRMQPHGRRPESVRSCCCLTGWLFPADRLSRGDASVFVTPCT